MPIQSNPTAAPHPIRLANWSTTDLNLLAEAVAWLLLGRRAHAQGILAGNVQSSPELTNENINEAVAHLTCPDQTSMDKHGNIVPHNSVIHRDGWLFQFISWIVLKTEFPASLMKAPQARKADKGFDGLMIELDGSSISFVFMVEDKATDSPRSMVTDSIWPEFEVYERGLRDNEMAAEASTMLEHVPGLDAHELTRTATWFRTKRYRASIATSQASLPPVVHTFAGYDDVITGNHDRRFANLYVHDALRPFFEDLAQRTIGFLESQRPQP